MDDYVVLRVLRAAIYGHVALVRHRATGGVFAMKIMSLAHMETQRAVSGPQVHEDGTTELRVLRRISRNRVPVKGSVVDGDSCAVDRNTWSAHPEWETEARHDHLLLLHTDFVDERSNARCLVLDYCPYGELYDQLQLAPTKMLGVETARLLFSQIATAVRVLHTENIAHRDVSLENVLVDAHRQCRLGDFGLACEQGATSSGRVGKPFYMAPEVFNWQPGRVYNGLKADVWSLGIVLFIMVSGAPPFEAPREIDARFRVVKEKGVRELLAMWKLDVRLPFDLSDLLTLMLAIDPEERISIEGVWSHPWMRQEIEVDGWEDQDLFGGYVVNDDDTEAVEGEEESEPQQEAESDTVADSDMNKQRHRKKIRITIDDSSFCDEAATSGRVAGFFGSARDGNVSISTPSTIVPSQLHHESPCSDGKTPAEPRASPVVWPKVGVRMALRRLFGSSEKPPVTTDACESPHLCFDVDADDGSDVHTALQASRRRPRVDSRSCSSSSLSAIEGAPESALCRFCLQWVPSDLCRHHVTLPTHSRRCKTRRVCDACFASLSVDDVTEWSRPLS